MSILEDLEKSIQKIGYRYQPDLHGKNHNNVYRGTGTVTKTRLDHGGPELEKINESLRRQLEKFNTLKNKRRIEFLLESRVSQNIKNSHDEGWTKEHREIAWAFLVYTFRGALDRLARLFDPRETIYGGAGAYVKYPNCSRIVKIYEKPINFRGTNPSKEAIDNYKRSKKAWEETHKQLVIICTHTYEVFKSLETYEKALMYWARLGGKRQYVNYMTRTVLYIKNNIFQIVVHCPTKKRNVKRINKIRDDAICSAIEILKSSEFRLFVNRLLRSRTRLPETRALYLEYVHYQNSPLLRLK